MTTRREFLAALATTGAGVPAAAEFVRGLGDPGATPAQAASDEDYWAEIARAYAVDRSVLNLNNGGVSPSPTFVQEAMRRHLEFSNMLPSHNLTDVLQPQKETVRAELARVFGCDPEEVAITRNTSEGLQTCQLGFDLEPGDEVLCTDLDYKRMIATFGQRERRDGIELVTFPIPVPNDDPGAIVDLYRECITERTKLILVCHIISPTGQIMPVREVVALGRERGIPVLVDGAHSFAHLDFTHEDLDCDYYATSLHKWLCAPHGTGMLYVRRGKIDALWPLMAARVEQREDIRKFEEIGTAPLANPLAIAEALVFHEGIGIARKHARLLHLRDTWAKRLAAHDRVRLMTSLAPGAAGGFATFAIDGVDPLRLRAYLWDGHKILTTAWNYGDGLAAVRVSPHVYTMSSEIERFCEVVERVVRDGLPN